MNPPLEDGERLYVYYVPEYHQQHEAAIMGEVQRPGVYPIREGQGPAQPPRRRRRAASGRRPTSRPSACTGRTRAAQEKDPELDRLLRLSRKELTATEYEVMRTKLAALRGVLPRGLERACRPTATSTCCCWTATRSSWSGWSPRSAWTARCAGRACSTSCAGSSVNDYVKQAGGFTDRAWRGKVRVTRAVTGQTLLARNVRTLDPGDFIWVPEKPDVTAWEQAREILTALAQVATIVIAIQSVK